MNTVDVDDDEVHVMTSGFDRTIALWDMRQPVAPFVRMTGHHSAGKDR